MNTLHKKWKLCGNRQKIFFSKVSGGCKRKTFVRLLLRVLGFQPARHLVQGGEDGSGHGLVSRGWVVQVGHAEDRDAGGVSGLDTCLTVFQHQCPRRGGAQLLAGNEEDIRRGLAAALGQVRAEHKGVKTTADAVLVQDAVGPVCDAGRGQCNFIAMLF